MTSEANRGQRKKLTSVASEAVWGHSTIVENIVSTNKKEWLQRDLSIVNGGQWRPLEAKERNWLSTIFCIFCEPLRCMKVVKSAEKREEKAMIAKLSTLLQKIIFQHKFSIPFTSKWLLHVLYKRPTFKSALFICTVCVLVCNEYFHYNGSKSSKKSHFFKFRK